MKELKAMISQPMNGRSEEEIEATREKAITFLKDQGYELVNTLFTDEWYSDKSMTERGVINKPLCFFAKSIEKMANVNAVYFCKGWQHTRGCNLEHDVAAAYGVKCLYED